MEFEDSPFGSSFKSTPSRLQQALVRLVVRKALSRESDSISDDERSLHVGKARGGERKGAALVPIVGAIDNDECNDIYNVTMLPEADVVWLFTLFCLQIIAVQRDTLNLGSECCSVSIHTIQQTNYLQVLQRFR